MKSPLYRAETLLGGRQKPHKLTKGFLKLKPKSVHNELSATQCIIVNYRQSITHNKLIISIIDLQSLKETYEEGYLHGTTKK